MPKITARKRQAMEMRAKIQNAALDLFDREGFDNVSMAEIAEASGCSVGNIYNYFHSKDELAIQLTDHVDAAYDELETAYREDTGTAAMEKLLDFVWQSLLISSREAVLYTTFIHSMKYPQQGILKIKEQRTYFRLLRTLIEACQEEGSLPADRDPAEIRAKLVTIHRGELLEWKICAGSYDLAGDGRALAAAYLRGIGGKVPAGSVD